MNGGDEMGWISPQAAKASLRLVGRRLALRTGMQRCQMSLAALLHRLDQRPDPDGGERASLGKSGVSLASGDQEDGVDQVAILPVESREEAEQQLLEGMDLVLQLLDRLDVGMRHGLFSLHAAKAIPTEEAGHRLSEAAK